MLKMRKLICLSTGSLRHWSKGDNRDNLVSMASTFDVDGVELMLPRTEDVLGFSLSPINRKWMKTLEYVSIHAPYLIVKKMKDMDEIMHVLERIQSIYSETGARTVVFHPDTMPKADILKQFDFHVSIENLEPRKRFDLERLESHFRSYPKTGFCLDVSHAFLYGEDETNRLLDAFYDRITEIHFSFSDGQKCHLPFSFENKSFLNSVLSLKNIDAPIVIEEGGENRKKEKIKFEISILKEFLYDCGEKNAACR